MKKPALLFVHGPFLTGQSWDPWRQHFEARGHACLAPSWPLHEGEPAQLRARPPAGLGSLALERVVESFNRHLPADAEQPVLIGHSVGGLIVQRLVAAGLGRAGVCIGSVAPNRMLTLGWDFLRKDATISHPLRGDEPYEMSPEGFHRHFANTLDREDSDRAHELLAVHESRNVLRDCLGRAGHIDLERPHVPLLFVAGGSDHMVPAEHSEENARAYTDPGSTSDFVEFPGRGHLLCCQPGWQDIADYVEGWLETHLQPDRAAFATGLSSAGF